MDFFWTESIGFTAATAAAPISDSDQDTLFDIVIEKGIYFKALLQYLNSKNGSITGNFILRQNNISFRNISEDHKIMNEVVIEASRLKEYSYNRGLGEYFPMRLDISRLITFLESCKADNKINLYATEKNRLNLAIINTDDSIASESAMAIQPENITIFDINPHEISYFIIPNCEITVENFISKCKHCAKIKPTQIELKCFAHGMQWDVVSSQNDKTNVNIGLIPPYNGSEPEPSYLRPAGHVDSSFDIIFSSFFINEFSFPIGIDVITSFNKILALCNKKDLARIFYKKSEIWSEATGINKKNEKYVIRLVFPIGDMKDACIGYLTVNIFF